MKMDLDGKVALVTGAQQGIGRAIAIALARAGADVAINYLDNAAAAEAVAAEVRTSGRRTALIQGDVSGVAAATEMVASAERQLGQLDIEGHVFLLSGGGSCHGKGWAIRRDHQPSVTGDHRAVPERHALCSEQGRDRIAHPRDGARTGAP